jgi:ABC-type branched-subunit amino acid transport system substrate-binding protein
VHQFDFVALKPLPRFRNRGYLAFDHADLVRLGKNLRKENRDPFSKTVLTAAKAQAKAAGLDIVMDESYAPSTTDFGPIVNKIISSNADAFLGGGHYSDGATLARQMHDQKADLKWISILVAPGDDKFGELGSAALGVTVPSQWEPQVSYKPQFGPTARRKCCSRDSGDRHIPARR